jgi:hypothetical protein
LQHILTRALQTTATLWPSLREAYMLVHQAAHLLANHAQQSSATVRSAYDAWLQHMAAARLRLGSLGSAIDHFLHISANFAAGLFHCYDVADLPRTNNDLEHCFRMVRSHERRATGRRGAIPALVVRGAVRVLAILVTKLCPLPSSALQPADYQAWRRLRKQLEYRHEARRQQFRFRKNPTAYLATLEARLLQ